MNKPSLRAALNSGEIVIAPGIHDMIAAVISNKIGFDFVYGSGFWTTASAYGLPDAGIATYTQMLDRMATLTRTVRATCVDSMSHGFIALVVRDAVGDRDPRPHEANLYDMNAKYADVVPATEAAGYLRSTARGRASAMPHNPWVD